jgi:hypothetical protein
MLKIGSQASSPHIDMSALISLEGFVGRCVAWKRHAPDSRNLKCSFLHGAVSVCLSSIPRVCSRPLLFVLHMLRSPDAPWGGLGENLVQFAHFGRSRQMRLFVELMYAGQIKSRLAEGPCADAPSLAAVQSDSSSFSEHR